MCCTYLLLFCGFQFHSFILCFGEQEFLILDDLLYWGFLLVFVSFLIKILCYSKVTKKFSALISKYFSILTSSLGFIIQRRMLLYMICGKCWFCCFVFFLNNELQALRSYVATDICVLLTSVQFSLVTQSCLALCNSMNCSTPGLPVHHQLPEFTQTHIHRVSDAIQTSHPLSSLSHPAPNPSQHQSLFQWVSSSH